MPTTRSRSCEPTAPATVTPSIQLPPEDSKRLPVSASTRARVKNRGEIDRRPDSPSPLSQVSYPRQVDEHGGEAAQDPVEEKGVRSKPESAYSRGGQTRPPFDKIAHEEQTIKRLLNAGPSLLFMSLPNEQAREFYDAVCEKRRVAVYATDLRHCIVKWTHTVEEFEFLSRGIRNISGQQSIVPEFSAQPGFAKTLGELEAEFQLRGRPPSEDGIEEPSEVNLHAAPTSLLVPVMPDSVSTYHAHRRVPQQKRTPNPAPPPIPEDGQRDPVTKQEPFETSLPIPAPVDDSQVEGSGATTTVAGLEHPSLANHITPENDSQPPSSHLQLPSDQKRIAIAITVLSAVSAALGGLCAWAILAFDLSGHGMPVVVLIRLCLVPAKVGFVGWMAFLAARCVFRILARCVSAIVGRVARVLVRALRGALGHAIVWLSHLHERTVVFSGTEA